MMRILSLPTEAITGKITILRKIVKILEVTEGIFKEMNQLILERNPMNVFNMMELL